jgi:hypothetical protein
VNRKLSSPILNELRPLLPAYITLFGFSFFSPILYLASPIFIEQMYDRVIYSRSTDTLCVLAVIATYLIVMFCILEWVRKKALARLIIDERSARLVRDALRSRMGTAQWHALGYFCDFKPSRPLGYVDGLVRCALGTGIRRGHDDSALGVRRHYFAADRLHRHRDAA